MITIKPPYLFKNNDSSFFIFLAGSIEMGKAEDWQTFIERELQEEKGCILNPRRNNWDSSWKQEKANLQFHEQVSWELNGLEQANLIVFYFAPNTQSPISLLELGLFARSKKVIVCCPEGFWRKGNVDIVCERFNIEQVNDLNELVKAIKVYIKSQI
jgi:hypothetical protein